LKISTYILFNHLAFLILPAGNTNTFGLDMLMNMFGGLGAGGLTNPENPNGADSHLIPNMK